MRLLLGLSLLTLNLQAATWNDLEVSRSYKINHQISLKQIERSGSIIEILPNEPFVLKEVIGLDMINVVLYRLNYKNCPGADLKTEMEIIPVKKTTPVVEVGAQIEENCMLEIFLETKDLRTESLFE
jgi:hypothetical protein